MDSSEIVKHEIQRECMDMVLNFLGMRICQPSESVHIQMDLQVHALYITGRNMIFIGVTRNAMCLGSAALSGAVAGCSFRWWKAAVSK